MADATPTYENKALPKETLQIATPDADKFQGGVTGLAKSGWTPVADAKIGGAQSNNPVTMYKNGAQINVDPADVAFETSAGYSTTAPTAPTNTLTSDEAKADSNNTLADLQRRQQEMVAQQQKALSAQLAAETQGINTRSAFRERQLGAQQKEESMTDTALQFKLGRASTEYASDATRKLNQIHQDQMTELDQQREDLIAKATAAYQSGNIALAKEALKADQDAYDKQQQLKQQMRENTSRDLQDALNNAKLKTDTSKAGQEAISTLAKSGVDISRFTDEAKAKYEKDAGLPQGTFDNYYSTEFAAANAKTQSELVDAQTKILDFASKIPPGETRTIAGNTYTSSQPVNDKKDVFQTTETDKNGNVTQVFTRLDPATGRPVIVGSVSLGKIGKGNVGDGSGNKDTYFTKPKADGSIGYYYGNEKGDVSKAQSLEKKAYLEGVSKAAGVLDPGVPDSAEIIQSGKNTVANLLSSGQKVSDIEASLYKDYASDLTPEELKSVVDYLHTEGEVRDKDKWIVGKYKGKG